MKVSSKNPAFNCSVWIWAARPKTLIAGSMPVLIATSLVYFQYHHFSWLVFWCGLLTALSIQIGINYTNDALDFIKGADTEKSIGFARAVQKGWLTPQQMLNGGYLAFLLGFLFSLPIGLHSPAVLGIVSLSILGGYLYTGGPFPIAYVGLGELFVIAFFGFAITCTVYYAYTETLHIFVLLASLQLGLLSAAILATNNLRDVQQDKEANKKTLAVRFGITWARVEVSILLLLPFVVGLAWCLMNACLFFYLPLIALPLVIKVIREIWTTEPSEKYNTIFSKVALSHLLFCILFLVAAYV